MPSGQLGTGFCFLSIYIKKYTCCLVIKKYMYVLGTWSRARENHNRVVKGDVSFHKVEKGILSQFKENEISYYMKFHNTLISWILLFKKKMAKLKWHK